MINTHVAKKDLLAIQSLLDSILLNLNKNNKREQISYYPETQLYKQELYSPYNQLAVIINEKKKLNSKNKDSV
jgi:hypothetical protein